jgi:HAE1 family hydrophobic/amphiphilic exporter-1
VDNAVVVLENIYRYYQNGSPPFTAAVKATKEVWGAVLSSTLTTMAVFIPVLFVEEEAGQLFRDIALAISCGIGLSLLVSLTLIPTAAARLLRSRPGEPTLEQFIAGKYQSDGQPAPASNGEGALPPERAGPLRRLRDWGPVRIPLALVGAALHYAVLAPLDAFGRLFVRTTVGVNAFLQRSVLLRLAVVVGFTGASVWLSYLLLPKIEYLPAGNRNLVFGILLPPPGYNLDKMMAIGTDIENFLRPWWDVDPGSPEEKQLGYPPIDDYFYVARGRNLFLGLRSRDPQRARELVDLIQQLRGTIPGTFLIASQSSLFEQGLGTGRSIDVEITGPELERLIALGVEVIGKVPGAVPKAQAFPKPSLDLASPEEHVRPRREQAAEMGVKVDELGYTVAALVAGAYAGDYYKAGTKVDLTILVSQDPRSKAQVLEQMPVATRTGELVPLKAVADVVPSSGPEQINRRERQRAITIQVSPPPEMALEDALERIRTQIIEPMTAEGKLEGGQYQINLAGTADKLWATWDALKWNFILALLITYLLMAALFESWLYPFVVIMSVPLGAVGGFLGLWLLNLFVLQTLDVLTMLGFVILIGTVVNNPILIVEQSLVHMREEGMPMRQAILEAVRNRIRPIFMTTITTVFGLIPLVLFPGAGSELYRGLGAVLLGGLMVSTVVSLVVVPTLFSLTMEAKEALLRLIGWRQQAPAPAGLPRSPREAPVAVSP